MKVILVGKDHDRSRTLTFTSWTRSMLSICLLGIPVGLGFLLGNSFGYFSSDQKISSDMVETWRESLESQRAELEEARAQSEAEVAALTLQLAEMQARLLRIDALGERLTTIAKLDKGEFDFSQTPAVGGPESQDLGDSHQPPDFVEVIEELGDRIDDRALQLEMLESLLSNRKIEQDLFLAGRPIRKGWMSSGYGRRTDPFKGHVAWHDGVDFAGKMGSDIISVASGVVTWSGERSGYGQMVEVNHGNGYTTRYAHNKENLVKVGDVVKKGQTLALMGSSGRSTGPHVHFEVYKHGRSVDPASYVHRTVR